MPKPIDDSMTVETLTMGFQSDDTTLDCLFCGHVTHRGQVYRDGDDLVDAELAMKRHLMSAHGSVFTALLALGKKGTGLSDTQRALLTHWHEGLSDREIQPLMGGVTLSTLRNHRFNLREKARQARVFVALMDLLGREERDPTAQFIEIPGSKSASDERFAITQAEFDRYVRLSFPEGPDGPLRSFPKKEKRKIAVMIQLRKRFDPSREYTQNEVNEILATASDDYTTLCRFMVDYGFLGRTRDGSRYWVE